MKSEDVVSCSTDGKPVLQRQEANGLPLGLRVNQVNQSLLMTLAFLLDYIASLPLRKYCEGTPHVSIHRHLACPLAFDFSVPLTKGW